MPQKTGRYAKTVAEVKADLARLRQHPLWGAKQSETTPDEIYRAVLCDRVGSHPVFRLCLLGRAGLAAEALPDSFRGAYFEKAAASNRAFGGFIPEALRQEAHMRQARLAFHANANATAVADWPVYQERQQERRQRPPGGVATGIAPFDRATWGLRGTTLLAGDTGVGKSSFALDVVLGALREDPGVAGLYLTLELTKDAVYERVLCREAGVSSREAARPSPEQAELLAAAEARVTSEILPRLRVVEWTQVPGREPLDCNTVVGHVEQLLTASGAERVVIVIDYLQRLDVEGPDSGDTGQTVRLSEQQADDARLRLIFRVQRWTRLVCVPEGFPVIAVSEVRKPESSRRRLSLADVRGSHDLVYSVGSVLLLEQEEGAAPSGGVVPVLLNVAKPGDGGEKGDVPLDFHYKIYRFRERAERASRSADAKPAKARTPAGKASATATGGRPVPSGRYAGK